MGRPAVALLDAFDGCRMLIAYYFMWHTGHAAPEQWEGCTWVTSRVRELPHVHSRDVTCAKFAKARTKRAPAIALHGLGDALVLAQDSLATLLVGRHLGRMHSVLLPAIRIQRLRDLLDDDAWRRGDG